MIFLKMMAADVTFFCYLHTILAVGSSFWSQTLRFLPCADDSAPFPPPRFKEPQIAINKNIFSSFGILALITVQL